MRMSRTLRKMCVWLVVRLSKVTNDTITPTSEVKYHQQDTSAVIIAVGPLVVRYNNTFLGLVPRKNA
jgi:hypothetical protein